MSDDRNSTARAPIRFAAEGSGSEPGDEQAFVAFSDDEEMVLETEPPKHNKRGSAEKKGGGLSRTMIVAGLSMFLLVILLGGLFIYTKQKRVVQEDEYGARSQPAYVQEESQRPAPTPAPDLSQRQPQRPSAGPEIVQGLAPSGSAPIVAAAQPITATTVEPVSTVIPAVPPNVDVGKLDAKIADLTQRLVKLESSIATLLPVVEKLAQADKSRAAQASVPAKAPVKPEPKTVKEPVAAPVKAAPTASTPPKGGPGKTAKAPAKPDDADGGAASSTNTFDPKTYTVTSVIGNRAWIVKTQGDGSESEYSVAPGEFLEGTGRVVTSVDGKLKRVCFENGQCVVKR